jgi:hypothetical protein
LGQGLRFLGSGWKHRGQGRSGIRTPFCSRFVIANSGVGEQILPNSGLKGNNCDIAMHDCQREDWVGIARLLLVIDLPSGIDFPTAKQFSR